MPEIVGRRQEIIAGCQLRSWREMYVTQCRAGIPHLQITTDTGKYAVEELGTNFLRMYNSWAEISRVFK